jgi:dihydroflavonol-4-reductase
MKTLVIGGTGLLGQALIPLLLQNNKMVKASIRPQSPEKAVAMLKKMDIELSSVDIRDKASIEQAIDGVDEIYITAALFVTWTKNKSEFEDVNIRGVENVLRAAFKNNVRRIVYTSSHGIFGLKNYPEFTTERDMPDQDQFKYAPYLQSKYAAWQIVKKYCSLGLDIVTVHPVGIIGINDFGNNPTNKYIRFAVKKIVPKFYVDAYTCLVDARDAAQGHILAMEKGKKGGSYILGGENISFKEYFEFLANLANIKQGFIKLPLSLILGYAHLQQWLSKLSTMSPQVTPDSVRFLMKRTRYSCAIAQKELGYQYRSVWEAIRGVFDWFNLQIS